MISAVKLKAFLVMIVFVVVSSGWAMAEILPKKNGILPPPDHSWRSAHIKNMQRRFMADDDTDNPRIFQDIDVENYTLNLDFDVEKSTLEAEVIITATVLENTPGLSVYEAKQGEIIVDFHDDVPINSILFNGVELLTYERKDNKIYMDVSNSPLDVGDEFVIAIDYTFSLSSDFGNGIVLRDQNKNTLLSDLEGNSIYAICTADQPYNSSAWWPCFDYPSDKATYDIHITCPDYLIAVSNGSLQSGYPEVNGDGTKTFFWKEKYQMYTSAFAIAISEYVTWDDTYVSPLDGTEMPLNYFAFPLDAEKAKKDYTLYNEQALSILPVLFGEYPFIDEKYGILESPFKMGSLEHQTITHLTYTATQRDSPWAVIVHELGHQWWGDWVTCDTWQHVWLHEGFATYSEILFHEFYTGGSPGELLSESYDDGLYDGELSGTPYAEDIANPWDDDKAIYDKAGWVVHILRNIIGDDNFFAALKSYGQAHANSTAVTDDLRVVLEEAYGASLEDVFDQWIYTPYRPVYQYEFTTIASRGKYMVDVLLYQTQDHMINNLSGNSLRDYYIMPVDITVNFKDGDNSTFTVFNNHRKQRFQFNVDKEPVSIDIDKEIKILKTKETPISDKGSNVPPAATAMVFPKTVSVDSSVLLFGRGKDVDGSIAAYSWVIDNREIVEGRFNIITFSEPGEHQILLTVEDNNGAAGTAVPVVINVE